jgi:CDP-glucose 4,6-dehydratase
MEGLVNPSPGFWRGKRVLITGHTGFKGGWLAHWLARLGAAVTGFALAPDTEPSLFEQSRLGARIASTIGDVRDADAVRRVVAAARPDIVLHLAAQALVRRSYADPVGTFATNVLGTAHVLDSARDSDTVRAIVSVTSDKCYLERAGGAPYRETDPLGGGDPYSSSKACAEHVTAAYRHAFFAGGAALASARAGNVIGGGDWASDRLVPDCVRAFAAGRAVAIRNPAAVRPWQHVLEPLAGYLVLAERLWTDPGFAEAWNFGPADADARPVADLVAGIARRWGSDAGWTAQAGAHPHEAATLRLDSAKARQRLGWAPRLDLERALDWTVEWYRRCRSGEAAEALVDAQIAAYEARVEAA